MSPSSNAERQQRFRQLTAKERQLKADALDMLLATIDAKQAFSIPLHDGRQLKVTPRNDHVKVELVSDPKMQSEIAQARIRILYGE